MSYLDFYGLKQEPFSNAPVSRFYFSSQMHERAFMRLKYAIENMKGLAVLSGDIGAGKTTLARRMLDSLSDTKYEAALLVIIHSGITAQWLLKRIALQLGVENPAEEKLALLSQLYRRLLQIHQEGRKAVVLIDEVQMLKSRELMEEFRGMLNLEIPEQKLITFVFFGLPEIEENLKLDPPLLQRVAVRCRLDSLDIESTQMYIQHRIKLAGGSHAIFDQTSIRRIHQCTKGVPRLINTVCDNALFEGSLRKLNVIGEEMIDMIARDLSLVSFVPTYEGMAEASAKDAKAVPAQKSVPSAYDPIMASFDESPIEGPSPEMPMVDSDNLEPVADSSFEVSQPGATSSGTSPSERTLHELSDLQSQATTVVIDSSDQPTAVTSSEPTAEPTIDISVEPEITIPPSPAPTSPAKGKKQTTTKKPTAATKHEKAKQPAASDKQAKAAQSTKAEPQPTAETKSAPEALEDEYEEIFERISTEDMDDINSILDGLEDKSSS